VNGRKEKRGRNCPSKWTWELINTGEIDRRPRKCNKAQLLSTRWTLDHNWPKERA